MKKAFEVIPPIMPNFVRFKQEPGVRQNGFKPDDGFPIKNFTREEAEEFAELMKKTFLEHWELQQVEPLPINIKDSLSGYKENNV